MTDLSGRVALVTGASRGFGRAAALEFAKAGAHVVALARTVGALEDLDDAIQAVRGRATLVPLDITDDDGLKRLGAGLFDRWGRIDLWLHTASYAAPLSPVAHIGEAELDKALAVNVRSFQRLIHVLDPLLRLSSNGMALVAADASESLTFHGLYRLTKAAQATLTGAWAAEAVGRITVAHLVLPPMPTAQRARFYPGEPKDALANPADVAARLIPALAAVSSGESIRLDPGP
ncbi:MAG: SDR family NAD(P)-dependent oxidoreductase [Pikeienuella sp.]